MKDAYEMLFVNREQIKILDSDNPEKADRLIRERLGQTRLYVYGDPNGEVKNSGRISPKIREMDTFEKLKKIISLDIEKIIAYDKIRTKSKREEYNKKLEKQNNVPAAFLKINDIQLKVGSYINSMTSQDLTTSRKGTKVNASGLLDVLEPEDEEYWSSEKSEKLDKKISNRYNTFKERYEQTIRGGIIKNFYSGEFDEESLIESSLVQLKLKWAYDKIKDRDSRRQYHMDREFSLSKEQLKRMGFYSKKGFINEDVENPTKYVIDWDEEEFYLRPIESYLEEREALEEGKTVIYNTSSIKYKQDMGVSCKLEEYAVKRMNEGNITVNHIIADNLSIASMTKSRTTGVVDDRQYANFVLGRMLSNYSIDGCIQYRFGFIGTPNKSKDGMYEQYFSEEELQFARQLKERSIVVGD